MVKMRGFLSARSLPVMNRRRRSSRGPIPSKSFVIVPRMRGSNLEDDYNNVETFTPITFPNSEGTFVRFTQVDERIALVVVGAPILVNHNNEANNNKAESREVTFLAHNLSAILINS